MSIIVSFDQVQQELGAVQEIILEIQNVDKRMDGRSDVVEIVATRTRTGCYDAPGSPC